MFLKVHSSYRLVVAVCDADLIGKKFEEDKRQLDIREGFFKGEDLTEEALLARFQRYAREDATFNIVGKHSITTALKVGLIYPEDVMYIQGIPFVLVF